MYGSLCAAILASTCLCAPAKAGNFYAFGDSLVDNGNTPKYGVDYPPPPYSDYRFSNGKVWAQYFPGLTGLGFAQSNDYAVGGAFSGPLSVLGTTYNNIENLPGALGDGITVPLPSFTEEVAQFAATGTKLGAGDVVGVWVGANDYFTTLELVEANLESASAITTAVQTVAEQTTAGVNELVSLGGRRFVVFNLPELGDTPLFNKAGAATIGEVDEISAAHDSTLATYMESEHATTGANIIVVNEAQLFNELLANPAAYGKTNVTDACIDTPSCVTASVAEQNKYVFWDSVHPTTGTHLLIAEYAADQLNGLAGLAAPAQIGAAGAALFASQLGQRDEALRAGASGFSLDVPGQGEQGQIGGGGTLSGFFSAAYDNGNRAALNANNGFNYNIASFAFGVDDQLAPGLAVGAALGYGDNHGTVSYDGTVSSNAYELGAYATFYQPNYYLNLNLTYGFDGYNTASPGVVGGNITAKPSGNTYTFSGETGYVLHAAGLTYGPILGLNVNHASLASYTQSGDAALTQQVDAQDFTQVIADLGATAQTSLSLGSATLHPYLTATINQLLSGNGGNFDSVFTDEPTVQLTSTYTDGGTRTWAALSGGVSTAITSRLALSAAFSTTLAKYDGGDHSVTGNLRYSF